MARLLAAAMIVFAAGCPGGGDDGQKPPVDAGPTNGDALPGEADPVTVAFAPVVSTPALPVDRWVKGGDGLLYGISLNDLEASSDGGATWEARTTQVYQVAATSARLFAVTNANGIERSANGGMTWTPLIVPGEVAQAIVLVAATPATLWVEILPPTGDPRVFRSIDQGDSFTEAAAPPAGVARWTLSTGGVSGGETLVLSSVARVVRTTTGAAWDDLGTVPLLQSLMVTQAGTVLAYGTQATYVLFRRGPSDAAWTQNAPETTAWTNSQREAGELVRVATFTGAVETSANEGATWASAGVAALSACQVTSMHAFDAAVLATCHDTAGGENALRLPPAATAWTKVEPEGISGRDATDVSFTAAGRIVLATKHGLYLSDDATHWHHAPFAPDDAWPINAVAVSPNGQRMFVGSTVDRFAWLDATGALTVQTTLPAKATEHVRQAMWMSDQIIWVTTASDDDTDGHLLNGDPDRIGTWEVVNPLRNELNPQNIQPAGYHAVEACKLGSDYTIAVGAKEWFGTNNYEARLRVQFRLGTDDFMDVDTPYTPLAPTSISCAPNGTQSFTVDKQFVFAGNLIGPAFHKIVSSDLAGKPLVAKFAPDNRLWVITDQGVFRSTAPVDAH